MGVWPRSLPELVAAGLLVGAVLSGCRSRAPSPSAVTAPQTWEVRDRLPVQRMPEPEPRPTEPRITQQQQNASGTPRGGQPTRLAGEARPGGTPSWTRATSQTEPFGEPPSARVAGDASSVETGQGQSPPSSQGTGIAAGSNSDAQGEQQGGASPPGDRSKERAGQSASSRAASDANSAEADQGQSPPSSQATGSAAGSNSGAQGEQQGVASPPGDRSSGQAGQSTGDESLPELAAPSGASQAASAADDSAAPVYRDIGTGPQTEENAADAGGDGSATLEPVAEEAADEPVHDGDAADADDAAEHQAAPRFGGSTDAREVPPQRAKDAGWAVRPESVDAGGEPAESSLDGLGGGRSGSSSGAQFGEGAGGNDGSGEGIDGATALSDRSGTLGTIEEQAGEGPAVGAQQEESRDATPPPGEGSAAGQMARDHTGDPIRAAQPDTGSRPDRESPPVRPITVEELESPEPSPQPMGSEKWHKEVRGAWKLVTVLDPSRDFLPQGASERLIGIDPDARVLRAVMTWTGTVAVSMAVEYEVGFRPKRVEVLPLPHAPSKFPTKAGSLLGGGHFEPSLLPPPCELSWARRATRLTIGGAVYEAADPGVMIEVLSQPELRDPESDVVGWESEGQVDGTAAATVDFFGVQAEGRYFCYIVDISGSMKNNGGMLRLRMELERSLGSLPTGTRFSVLPFNSTLRELQPNWTSASPVKAQDIGRRLSRIGARGGTNPTGAFNWAFRELRPQPDAIFFMTDGQMKGIGRPLIETLGKLNASNPRTRVYTIGLGDDADMRFLEAMADQHGGTSRLVR